MLNTLDLSYNDLTGGIPSFPAGSSELRNLYLNNNQFSGAVGPQLLAFSRNQERTESSNVNIGYNALSGALPDVFYRMLTDAHGVGRLLVEGNNPLRRRDGRLALVGVAHQVVCGRQP